ncbi:hypothetical protein [Lacisediminihabitans sp. H27-G8]|uniref:hypothetical protein n=1 Tax=Lacisediminihabitans sp. H27-G8 TaxID=3111909 RepID=UPI0038FCA104
MSSEPGRASPATDALFMLGIGPRTAAIAASANPAVHRDVTCSLSLVVIATSGRAAPRFRPRHEEAHLPGAHRLLIQRTTGGPEKVESTTTARRGGPANVYR